MIKKEVLLVGLEHLTVRLLKAGYHVTNYAQQSQALDSLKYRRYSSYKMPDIILIQLYNTRSNLFRQLASWVHDLPSTIPMIILDLKTTPFRKQEAKDLGADDYLPLDIPFDSLLQQVNMLIRSSNYLPKSQHSPDFHISYYKQCFDIVVSSVLLLLLFPFFLMVIMAIKLESKGPAFYWQARVGAGYTIFKFHKFRSMRINADQLLGELESKNHYTNSEDQIDTHQDKNCPLLIADDTFISEEKHVSQIKRDEKNSFKKFKNDPRITRVGQFIRKTSIDELPQLIMYLLEICQ